MQTQINPYTEMSYNQRISPNRPKKSNLYAFIHIIYIETYTYIFTYVLQRKKKKKGEIEREPREDVGVIELEGLKNFANRTASEPILPAKKPGKTKVQRERKGRRRV